jgi:pyruvate dehydrogenase E1 component beta subunit
MAKMNIIQALNQAHRMAFTADDKVVAFGEDVGHFGGVFRVTAGLTKTFGEERCFNSPLSESGIVGFAIGMAQYGYRPIAEIQFADYLFPAYDQMVNELAKMRYRTGGQYTCPMVIRMPCGGGIHGGLYHSQSPEAQLLHTPGLVVVMASDPYDAKGLFLAAVQSEDPVIFLEPKRIYRASKCDVPEEHYTIPIGKAHVAREGSDLTLIGWGAQHHQNLKAARDSGFDVEVINLRTLNPLDIPTIEASVKKTGKCIVAHEAPRTQGFGAEITSVVMEKCFWHLEAPITRVCGLDTPFPHTLENEYLPDAHKVQKAIEQLMAV